jgi:hypothetical protein
MQYPESASECNVSCLNRVDEVLLELKELARKHNKSNMITQFALSRKVQSMLDEATAALTDAISKLQLGIVVTQLGVNLRIDENVSILLR